MRVRAQLILAGSLMLAGVAVVASPASDGPSVLMLRRGHGLSTGELVGLVPLAIGVAWVAILLVRYLPAVRRQIGDRAMYGLTSMGGFGLGIALVSGYQGEPWWTTGLLLLGIALFVLGGALASSTPG
ncbi:hypothetical protein GCM10012275_60190 [Longimycelium tulufanense]|uniref:Uncharacterized protein n=1 Tax=Longimycelium tulufanense TaxID=907463 RepID=A0A8J3CE57_9PSEU|nr:hypothetical protein [Longimycelium tulufanense]GGM81485.1 hypothetical protein GCM10012275_60190 [Longimycelium tulufanense]